MNIFKYQKVCVCIHTVYAIYAISSGQATYDNQRLRTKCTWELQKSQFHSECQDLPGSRDSIMSPVEQSCYIRSSVRAYFTKWQFLGGRNSICLVPHRFPSSQKSMRHKTNKVTILNDLSRVISDNLDLQKPFSQLNLAYFYIAFIS